MTTIITKDNGKRKMPFSEERLVKFIHDKLFDGLDLLDESKEEYIQKTVRQIKTHNEIDFKDVNLILRNNALEFITDLEGYDGESVDIERLPNTNFQHVAKRVLLNSLYKRASKNRSFDVALKYGDFYGLVGTLAEKGIYHQNLLEDYTKDELKEAGTFIVPERDDLLSYASVYQLQSRYIARDKDESRSVYELPQERFLTVALALSRKEDRRHRMEVVKDLYDAMSKLQLTMATPTLSNAGRSDGQLSSCFILTTEDSLRGIYDDNTDVATLSKGGGGIGIYLGKIRAAGSSVRGNPGTSRGVIPWIKQLDNTAVSVDQLGLRPGAVAAYLDMWHLDIGDFLELRLNTGDLSKRAHNIFTGLSIPDEFMRAVQRKGDWYLFDPKEITDKMGFSLEDMYDKKKLGEGEEPNPTDHAWTYHYNLCIDSTELKRKKRVPAIQLMTKVMISQLETGIPYVFYRDTVNRDNPNKHKGMIYSSNLCTEISQNQSPTTVVEEVIDGDKVIITKQSGDFVVCNLSSLVLNNIIDGKMTQEDKEELRKVIHVAVRATDNGIDVNDLPVPQARITNEKYRAIGIGEQGIAALLAKIGIFYDSEESIEFISELEEHIALYTIEASALLGAEKGSYRYFEGSDWNTGAWIDSRETTLDEWDKVKRLSMTAMRNGYLRAPAPTGSTSLIAGSTASIEAVYDVVHQDGKKDSKIPVVAPHLDSRTYFLYRPSMLLKYKGDAELGHMWSILQNEARQKWIDQSSSFNTYIPQDIYAPKFLQLHLETWNRGIKTSYYTRSHDASRISACIGCEA